VVNRARRFSKMAEGVPGFSPAAEEDVLLAGVRDAQTAEEERLAASRVTVVGADRIGREGLRVLAAALDGLRPRAGRVYVHLDLDVLDPAKAGRANEFAPEGGWGSMSSWWLSEWSADASTWQPAA
jgi:arginase